MNRREILRYTAWLTGTAISAPLAGIILSGCSEAPKDSVNPVGEGEAKKPGKLHFFAPEQFALVTLLADTILPRTDSPSASDVNVNVTIDSMLGQVFDDEYKAGFKRNWSELERHLSQHDFSALDQQARAALLGSLELSQDSSLSSARQALVELKQQVVAYYLTTEEIGKNHLNYVPIPGAYEP